MMHGSAWVGATVVLPLAGAILSVLSGRGAPVVGVGTSLATFGAGAALAREVRTHGTVRHLVGAWGVPLGIELRIDGPASLMLVVFGAVAGLVTVYVAASCSGRYRRSFITLCLFAWAALDALLVSNDVFNLYVALELLTLSAVALIALAETREAIEAAVRYLVIGLLGSLGYLMGAALLYSAHGTLDVSTLARRASPSPLTTAALALVAAGLCLKAALFPLHAWAPPAYASSSAAVSAVLSGALGKAPFIVLLRVWLGVFSSVVGPAPAELIGGLGALGIVWASILALRQKRLKMLLAYSSIAHVGYLFLVFPLGASAVGGTAYLAISHGLASAAMFVAAGTVERIAGNDSLRAVNGVAHKRPLTFFAFFIAGASLVGLPPSGGFIAKWLMARAALDGGRWWWAAVVLAGGLLTACYVFRILRGAFEPAEPHVHSVPRSSEIVALTLAVLALVLGVAPSGLVALASGGP